MEHEEIALTDQFYISKLLFTKFENHLHRFETSFRTKLHVSRQHSNPENLSISLGSISDHPFGWQLTYCPSLYTVQIYFLISCLKELICEFAHKKRPLQFFGRLSEAVQGQHNVSGKDAPLLARHL